MQRVPSISDTDSATHPATGPATDTDSGRRSGILPELGPASCLLVVFPTKHIGNLVIALGLLQRTLAMAPSTRFLIDARYLGIAAAAGIDHACIAYPRTELERAAPLRRALAFVDFVRRLRQRRFDAALDIEGDSVAVNTIRVCRAGRRIGCGTIKHPALYDHVVPMRLDPARAHRWHGYASAFEALGVEPGAPGYARMQAPAQTELPPELPPDPVVLHAGATKRYKLWPARHFATLIESLRGCGRAPVLIGAGATDRAANAAINATLDRPVPDLCDRLTLDQLMVLLARADRYIGNDSGPMHLAAALGARTFGLFGPTEVGLWRPLGAHASVVRSVSGCPPGCHRLRCAHDYQCMQTLTPAQVLKACGLAG